MEIKWQVSCSPTDDIVGFESIYILCREPVSLFYKCSRWWCTNSEQNEYNFESAWNYRSALIYRMGVAVEHEARRARSVDEPLLQCICFTQRTIRSQYLNSLIFGSMKRAVCFFCSIRSPERGLWFILRAHRTYICSTFVSPQTQETIFRYFLSFRRMSAAVVVVADSRQRQRRLNDIYCYELMSIYSTRNWNKSHA